MSPVTVVHFCGVLRFPTAQKQENETNIWIQDISLSIFSVVFILEHCTPVFIDPSAVPPFTVQHAVVSAEFIFKQPPQLFFFLFYCQDSIWVRQTWRLLLSPSGLFASSLESVRQPGPSYF